MNWRAVTVALLLSFILTSTASAHATVVRCDPAIGANLQTPPDRLTCFFTEPLIAANSTLVITDAQGQRVDRGDTQEYAGQPAWLVVTLNAPQMTTGLYTVSWRVTSAIDNGVTQDKFQFGIRTPVPPTPTPILPGVVFGTSPSASELVARFLIALGVIVLGVTGFFFWRNRKASQTDTNDE